MDHKVSNVQSLYEDAKSLYHNNVMGGGDSADSILNALNSAINNLKENWKGADAGKRIQDVINIYNKMVVVRNALADLASLATGVAAQYREIQNANGAGLEVLGTFAAGMKTKLEDYSDNTDTIDINSFVSQGRDQISNTIDSLSQFKSNVQLKYDDIMKNWTVGTGRDSAATAFDTFIANVESYKKTLSEVSDNINKALSNYNASL